MTKLGPQAIDIHVGRRMRQLRIERGWTQQNLADVIGVTYQQESKYEKCVNRISSGRLYQIAQALGVEVGFFFEGVDAGVEPPDTPADIARLEMLRAYNVCDAESQGHIRALAYRFAKNRSGESGL